MAHNQNHLLQQLMMQQQMMGNQSQPSNMNTTGMLNPNMLTMPGACRTLRPRQTRTDGTGSSQAAFV